MPFFITAASAPESNPQGGTLLLVFYLVIFGGAIYFMMIRPQKKKQKAEEKLRNSTQVGDEIVTIAGVYGRIVAIKEDSLIIESGPDRAKQRIARWAIQTNLTVRDDAEDSKAKAKIKAKDSDDKDKNKKS